LINRPRDVTGTPDGDHRKGSWRRVITILALALALAVGVLVLAPHADQDSYAKAKDYLDAREYTKALPLLRIAANAGNPEAMYQLGDLYRNASGVAPDYAEAVKWYRSAADNGNSWGMDNLGKMYKEGWPVAPNPAEAVKWYKSAAGKGNSWGMYHLAEFYESGWEGVAPDYKKASDLYQRAAADAGLGSPKKKAEEALQRLHSEGRA
jgi:TPR repeat protein